MVHRAGARCCSVCSLWLAPAGGGAERRPRPVRQLLVGLVLAGLGWRRLAAREISERSEGSAHPPRRWIQKARQLGQRLRQADRLDRFGTQQRLQLVGLTGGASIS